MDTNTINWESHKPNWQSQIRAHNLKRERTQSEETQSLVNRQISSITQPKAKLKATPKRSLKEIKTSLANLEKEMNGQLLLSKIKKALKK